MIETENDKYGVDMDITRYELRVWDEAAREFRVEIQTMFTDFGILRFIGGNIKKGENA